VFAARSFLAEVLGHVVKFPPVLVEGIGPRLGLPGGLVHGPGHPAVVVDGPVAEDLEVLRGVPVLRLRVVEGIGHADPLDGALLEPVDLLRLRQAARLQDRRGDVDDVVELAPHFVLRLDPLRPVNDHPIASAAEARGHLLGPGERGVAPPRPSRRRSGCTHSARPVVDLFRMSSSFSGT
jgi:hypothetical protein